MARMPDTMVRDSEMVYWDIEVKNDTMIWKSILRDMAPEFGSFVSSIKVTDGISMPKKKNKKKVSAPSECEIVVSSNNYVEDLFTEGVMIKVFIGYDPVRQPLVFTGRIIALPDGSAKEMLHYVIKAYSLEVELGFKEKSKRFKSKTKEPLVHEIVLSNSSVKGAFVDIEDKKLFKAGYSPMQKGMSDTQMLDQFALDWRCSWWVQDELLYFVDEENAHSFSDSFATIPGPYKLGYRTDFVKNNVESVNWSQNPSPGGSAIQSIFTALGEQGKDKSLNEYKIVYKGQTWKLKGNYVGEIKTNYSAFANRAVMTIGKTATGNAYDVLKTFFVIDPSGGNGGRDIPQGGGLGMDVDITIRLNEGDPELKPPRTARLYNSVTNDSVDNAKLPDWLFRMSDAPDEYAELKINEIVLTYSQGRLTSELKCGMIGHK